VGLQINVKLSKEKYKCISFSTITPILKKNSNYHPEFSLEGNKIFILSIDDRTCYSRHFSPIADAKIATGNQQNKWLLDFRKRSNLKLFLNHCILHSCHYIQIDYIRTYVHMYISKTPKWPYIHTHTRSERLQCTYIYVCIKLRSYADRLINI